MHTIPTPGPAPEAFVWATGIEDTFVPQTRPGLRPLDEYELMGHYDHWREDLALARELGAGAIRWGIPWYRVEPRPGVFDWGWTDQVMPYIVEELGLNLVLDLMHYGTPLWLEGSFASPEYPRRVAAYARAVAERYGSLVSWFTPLNEPLVNAEWAGRRGVWPPYLRGDRGFLTVMINLALGMVETVEAFQAARPGAKVVHVEATGLSRAADDDLRSLVFEEAMRRFLATDLITGRVTGDHPLLPWLLRNGVSLAALRELAARPVTLDLFGLNFYPQWSTRQLKLDPRGRVSDRPTEKDGAGFAELITLYHARYGAPIMVTETSAFGSHGARSAWLAKSVADIKALRARGVPVLGYTWFPLFTMVDWRYRTGREPLERYYIDLGMYTLGQGGGPRWRPTPLVEEFRRLVADPRAAVGALVEDTAARPVRGS
ncbi:MAG TPA: family 1 glycosylhydrolase [Chloroflexaceae bacterium]|nr:family 1 glycosylhydrolase [Chloroflexaceae bacterium]